MIGSLLLYCEISHIVIGKHAFVIVNVNKSEKMMFFLLTIKLQCDIIYKSLDAATLIFEK